MGRYELKGVESPLGPRKLGTKMAFVGLVGDDQLGEYLREVVTSAGIDSRGLRKTAKALTCSFRVLINRYGGCTFFYFGGSDRPVLPS